MCLVVAGVVGGFGEVEAGGDVWHSRVRRSRARGFIYILYVFFVPCQGFGFELVPWIFVGLGCGFLVGGRGLV